MQKWMMKFLCKSESPGNKIDRVNSIRISNSINLFSFRIVQDRKDKRLFSVCSPLLEKSRVMVIKK